MIIAPIFYVCAKYKEQALKMRVGQVYDQSTGNELHVSCCFKHSSSPYSAKIHVLINCTQIETIFVVTDACPQTDF